jgi:hypothetical protein
MEAVSPGATGQSRRRISLDEQITASHAGFAASQDEIHMLPLIPVGIDQVANLGKNNPAMFEHTPGLHQKWQKECRHINSPASIASVVASVAHGEILGGRSGSGPVRQVGRIENNYIKACVSEWH